MPKGTLQHCQELTPATQVDGGTVEDERRREAIRTYLRVAREEKMRREAGMDEIERLEVQYEKDAALVKGQRLTAEARYSERAGPQGDTEMRRWRASVSKRTH